MRERECCAPCPWSQSPEYFPDYSRCTRPRIEAMTKHACRGSWRERTVLCACVDSLVLLLSPGKMLQPS